MYLRAAQVIVIQQCHYSSVPTKQYIIISHMYLPIPITSLRNRSLYAFATINVIANS